MIICIYHHKLNRKERNYKFIVWDVHIIGVLLLLLLKRPLCPDGMHIVGQWCSTPYTEAKEKLDSVP